MTTAVTAHPAAPFPLLLGRIAVEKGYLGRDDLDQCVREQEGDPLQRASRMKVPLGKLLVSRGLLSAGQLSLVLEEQQRRFQARSRAAVRQEDILFGQLVVKERLVSREDVNAAIRFQAVMAEQGYPDVPRLGRLLVEWGHLAPEDVVRILARQEKAVMVCSLCGGRINVAGAAAAQPSACRRCGGTLERPAPEEALHADDPSLGFMMD
jgi:hypothetical protein